MKERGEGIAVPSESLSEAESGQRAARCPQRGCGQRRASDASQYEDAQGAIRRRRVLPEGLGHRLCGGEDGGSWENGIARNSQVLQLLAQRASSRRQGIHKRGEG